VQLVLGANDGIVSTASLVLGVVAAGASSKNIVIAGVAGLVAGAMSMAAGEYVSVSSQAGHRARRSRSGAKRSLAGSTLREPRGNDRDLRGGVGLMAESPPSPAIKVDGCMMPLGAHMGVTELKKDIIRDFDRKATSAAIGVGLHFQCGAAPLS